jgi:hypothetical protein
MAMMKQKKRIGLGGNAFLLLTAAATASLAANSANAAVIVSNLTDTSNEHENSASDSMGQDFTTGSSSVTLDALTLSLDITSGTPTATVYLYATSAGGEPAGSSLLTATFTATSTGSQNAVFTINTADPTLSANTQYIVVLYEPASTIEWNATASSGSDVTASGTMGTDYYNNGNGSTPGSDWEGYYASEYLQFEADSGVSAVPEGPKTGLLMGFGALAVASGSLLRRKSTSPGKK